MIIRQLKPGAYVDRQSAQRPPEQNRKANDTREHYRSGESPRQQPKVPIS